MPQKTNDLEHEFLNQLKSGNDRAFLHVYKQYKSELISWIAKRFSLDREDCMEVYQLTMVSFYENVVSGKITHLTSSLKTYLFAIAKNKAFEMSRKRNVPISLTMSTYDEVLPEMQMNTEDELHDAESRMEAMHESMGKLGSPCSEIVTMFYFQKASLSSIQARFGYKSEESVKSQKFKCMERLRKIYFSSYRPKL